MDRYTVTFPNYTIGTEAYETIREECPRYGKTVVVIGGRRGVAAAQEKMVKAVEGWGSSSPASSWLGRSRPRTICARSVMIRPCRRLI